jgi:hypothetical protein
MTAVQVHQLTYTSPLFTLQSYLVDDLFVVSLIVIILWYYQTKVNTQAQSQCNNDDEHNDAKNPLELSRTPCMIDTLIELNVCGLGVGLNVLGLLLGLLNHGVLDYDLLSQILEQLLKFDEGLFDALNVIVTGSYSA